ncbi:uncharacterized protein LOC127701694 [Mytilus californianus]|uniref:uncharacterized protein LOC127701694 n=1 Tax=Mytilus californianus TaxID=6549 RepID=UPI002245FEA2|nr:uncharacterized protein LOC127701694 [Mytilus californianus]
MFLTNSGILRTYQNLKGMLRIITLLSVLVGVHLATTTTRSPEWEGTTDIPEEIEVGEDVTTNNSSIPTTPLANDPIEQNDFYNPTRRPQNVNSKTTKPVKVISMTTVKSTRKTTSEPTEAPEAMETEVEYEGTSGGNATSKSNLQRKNTGSCPPLHDAIVEHHVILRHGECEIVISQDDSIRWFNKPGKSPPSVFVRHINT